MTNTFIDARYAEGVHRLALGIEPRDALTGRATLATLDARFERIPEPFDRWRRWAPGETLTDALPALPRHRSGRFVLLYESDQVDLEERDAVACRVDDGPRAGRTRRLRRFVPRRFEVRIERRSAVEAAVDPSVPVDRRSLDLTLFPGAGAPIVPRTTAIRCRITTPPDGNGRRSAIRWCRVRVTADADGDVLGWGHGDDQGECLVVLGRLPSGTSTGDLAVRFEVGARIPPLDPNSVSEARRRVDPLWDLPPEDLADGPWAAADPGPSGRSFLPEHQIIDVGSDTIPIGRTTSVTLTIN